VLGLPIEGPWFNPGVGVVDMAATINATFCSFFVGAWEGELIYSEWQLAILFKLETENVYEDTF
jgi:hypothetical protein